MKKNLLKYARNRHQRRAFAKLSMKNFLIFLPIVITKRVKVANELYSKSDTELLEKGRLYVTEMTGNPLFVTPSPPLADCTLALNDFDSLIISADGKIGLPVTQKNAKREEVLNLLSSLGSYVEGIANLPANATTGAEAVIEAAGMRPKPFSPRQKQGWEVETGVMPGTLDLEAASVKGTHEWEYTYTPTDPQSWQRWEPGTKARITMTGLTGGSFVSCRHRTVTSAGVSAWEGHDPVVVR